MYRQRFSLESLFPGAEPEALDLVRKLLVFNPDRRLTADDSLRHPYVRRFHNPVSEMVVGHDIVPPVSDNEQLTISEYRNRLYEVPGISTVYAFTYSSFRLRYFALLSPRVRSYPTCG